MNIWEQNSNNDETPGPKKLFDLGTIKQLCRGNEQNIDKMIRVFVKTISTSMEEMKTGHSSSDLASLKKIAHRIRPTLALYAVADVEEEILRIEHEQLDTGELYLLIKKVDVVINEIVTQLKKEYSIA